MADEPLRVRGSLRAVFPGGRLTERMRRLFWSWPHPPSPEELDDEETALAALATVLAEGDGTDWRELDLERLTAVIDRVPLLGPLGHLWSSYFGEVRQTEENRERVLDDEQRKILRIAAVVLPELGFELAGGTALAAAYLGHRRSEDIDLFTPSPGIQAGLERLTEALAAQGLQVRVERPQATFAQLFVGERPVKVELASDSPFRLAASSRSVEGMPVRSLPDLAADKTLALFGRAALRDFVDVYVLARTHYDFEALMNLAAQKDPGFDRSLFAKALAQVTKLPFRGVDMLVPFDHRRMQEDLVEAARRILRQELERGDELER
ncbi:MAG: nucleotidyl transferase AbiEii/AbiGii toxin family protein [Chloroflexi bacterium]|nr:nucleotidyl transferase AbiEii/AbiGii toxin family protein [Chloroflexota bacterium]